jgi:hypothetical protein
LIRTRDPHLGKGFEMVFLVGSVSVKCVSVYSVSTPSTQSAPVVERSTVTAGLPRPVIHRKCCQQSAFSRWLDLTVDCHTAQLTKVDNPWPDHRATNRKRTPA